VRRGEVCEGLRAGALETDFVASISVNPCESVSVADGSMIDCVTEREI
jgi:hypothetical protein